MRVAGQKFKLKWKVERRTGRTRPSGGARARSARRRKVTYELAENDGGTRFTYTNEYDLPGGPIGKLAGRAVVGASGTEADKTLKRLKKLIEDG